MTTANNWTERIAWTMLTAVAVGAVGWAAWMSVELNQKVDQSEIPNLPYPYIAAKADINNRLQTVERAVAGKWSEVIQNNTEAIIRLEERGKNTQRVLEKLDDKLDRLNGGVP